MVSFQTRPGIIIGDLLGMVCLYRIRGTVATRLYIRSVLIPYYRITFSKRDCITLEWDEFEKLLLTPNEFKIEYKKKNRQKKDMNKDMIRGQMSLEFRR